MSSEEIKAIALAFTTKVSEATDPDQFLIDYEANKKAFEEALSKRPVPKATIRKKSDFGL